MEIIPVYRYIRPDGGVTVSPVKPDCEYTALTRLAAGEGRTITDGTVVTTCVDTDDPDAWEELVSDSEALAILLGGECA